jgi:excisionase family DNA binding protein
MESALMSTTEAARLLGVDRRTVIKWCEAGDLQAVRIGEGGHWRLIRSGVERIVREQPSTRLYDPHPQNEFQPSSTPDRNGGAA